MFKGTKGDGEDSLTLRPSGVGEEGVSPEDDAFWRLSKDPSGAPVLEESYDQQRNDDVDVAYDVNEVIDTELADLKSRADTKHKGRFLLSYFMQTKSPSIREKIFQNMYSLLQSNNGNYFIQSLYDGHDYDIVALYQLAMVTSWHSSTPLNVYPYSRALILRCSRMFVGSSEDLEPSWQKHHKHGRRKRGLTVNHRRPSRAKERMQVQDTLDRMFVHYYSEYITSFLSGSALEFIMQQKDELLDSIHSNFQEHMTWFVSHSSWTLIAHRSCELSTFGTFILLQLLLNVNNPLRKHCRTMAVDLWGNLRQIAWTTKHPHVNWALHEIYKVLVNSQWFKYSCSYNGYGRPVPIYEDLTGMIPKEWQRPSVANALPFMSSRALAFLRQLLLKMKKRYFPQGAVVLPGTTFSPPPSSSPSSSSSFSSTASLDRDELDNWFVVSPFPSSPSANNSGTNTFDPHPHVLYPFVLDLEGLFLQLCNSVLSSAYSNDGALFKALLFHATTGNSRSAGKPSLSQSVPVSSSSVAMSSPRQATRKKVKVGEKLKTETAGHNNKERRPSRDNHNGSSGSSAEDLDAIAVTNSIMSIYSASEALIRLAEYFLETGNLLYFGQRDWHAYHTKYLHYGSDAATSASDKSSNGALLSPKASKESPRQSKLKKSVAAPSKNSKPDETDAVEEEVKQATPRGKPLVLKLPDNLLKHVLSFLRGEDLLHLSETCKRFRELTEDDTHWSYLLRRMIAVPLYNTPHSLPDEETNSFLKKHKRQQKKAKAADKAKRASSPKEKHQPQQQGDTSSSAATTVDGKSAKAMLVRRMVWQKKHAKENLVRTLLGCITGPLSTAQHILRKHHSSGIDDLALPFLASAKTNLLSCLGVLMKEESFFETIAKDRSFYHQLLTICEESQDLEENRQAWKLIHECLRYHKSILELFCTTPLGSHPTASSSDDTTTDPATGNEHDGAKTANNNSTSATSMQQQPPYSPLLSKSSSFSLFGAKTFENLLNKKAGSTRKGSASKPASTSLERANSAVLASEIRSFTSSGPTLMEKLVQIICPCTTEEYNLLLSDHEVERDEVTGRLLAVRRRQHHNNQSSDSSAPSPSPSSSTPPIIATQKEGEQKDRWKAGKKSPQQQHQLKEAKLNQLANSSSLSPYSSTEAVPMFNVATWERQAHNHFSSVHGLRYLSKVFLMSDVQPSRSGLKQAWTTAEGKKRDGKRPDVAAAQLPVLVKLFQERHLFTNFYKLFLFFIEDKSGYLFSELCSFLRMISQYPQLMKLKKQCNKSEQFKWALRSVDELYTARLQEKDSKKKAKQMKKETKKQKKAAKKELAEQDPKAKENEKNNKGKSKDKDSKTKEKEKEKEKQKENKGKSHGLLKKKKKGQEAVDDIADDEEEKVDTSPLSPKRKGISDHKREKAGSSAPKEQENDKTPNGSTGKWTSAS